MFNLFFWERFLMNTIEPEQYKYKTELHAHSSGISGCSHVTAEELVTLYAQNGIDAVVLTNHFFHGMFEKDGREVFAKKYVAEWQSAAEFGKKLGVNVIPGMEIRFTECINDYLVYGIDSADVEKASTLTESGIKEFYRLFKTENNIILQAHPFRDCMELAPKDSIDGIEVFNMHPNHNSRVAVAAKYARDNHMKISGGTDFHQTEHCGMCVIRTKFKPETSFDIAKILNSGDFLFDISGNIVIPYNL